MKKLDNSINPEEARRLHDMIHRFNQKTKVQKETIKCCCKNTFDKKPYYDFIDFLGMKVKVQVAKCFACNTILHKENNRWINVGHKDTFTIRNLHSSTRGQRTVMVM